ncbi:Protein CBG26598 [Caenorhabditis briggsae]|nr:Protein CBG26598 [Caenorhabditis briggsae]UMM14726.1 hypothetical protein L5515_002422 [Caenorhabditis briggsae]UMM14727.1 hypothetical protein L5515_002423 [Caenorhabditis briggsae]CAS00578.1 Protein CBG26598 [Caenorhabditis briggsae]
MSKLSLLVFIVALAVVIGAAAGFGRHHLCGAKLLDTMIAVCPNGCDQGSDFQLAMACFRRMNKDDVRSACCPDA